MADYVSSLNGSQMDQALLDMAEHTSEAYAVGERNGVPVDSSDVTYHNNARYYAQQAQSIAPASVTEAVRWDIAQTALTDAQRLQARENINAADDDTSVQVVTQTFTPEQQKIARANIAAANTNPNLLDNPFFTINQRGFTTSTETNNIFSVDRWLINNGGGTVTKTANGITIDNTSGTRYNSFQQRFGADELAGKTVTLSLNDGGSIYKQTFTIPARTSSVQTMCNWAWKTGCALRFYVETASANASYTVQIYVANGYSADLRAVKLEVGTFSTLANDTPPDYETELLKCQRYFIRIAPTAYTTLWSGVCINASTFAFNITTPVPMRYASPTISFTGTLDFVEQTTSGASLRSVTGLSAYAPVSNSNNIRVLATTASTLGSNNLACIYTYAYTPVIDVSCDL